MSADDELMLSLAGAIADGSAIDWADVESKLEDPERLQVLRRLHTVSGISDVCRATDVLPADGDEQASASVAADPLAAEPFRVTLGGGRFIVTGRLGKGAFGVVYEGYDRQRNAHVAIKRCHGVDVGSIYDVKKEFRVLADLCHPNLVTLYDLFADADDWFISMELVRGVDFLTYVWGDGAEVTAPQSADGRRVHRIADWQRLERATSQLVEAVRYLHEHDKLHRDIKPSNVLVTPDRRLKVLDFGLTTDLVADVMGDTFRILGTPGYIAPEQAAGEPPSEASDWYSVGVMLYESICGHRPFDGRFLQVLEAKQREDARPLSAL